jgi:hypothetical protein
MGVLSTLVDGLTVLTRTAITVPVILIAYVFRNRLTTMTKYITLTAATTWLYTNIVMPDDYDAGIGDIALTGGISAIAMRLK